MKKGNLRYGDYFKTNNGKYCMFIEFERDDNIVVEVYDESWYKTINIDSIVPIKISYQFLTEELTFEIASQYGEYICLSDEIKGKRIYVSNYKISGISEERVSAVNQQINKLIIFYKNN